MSPEIAEVKQWLEKAGSDHRAAEVLLGQTPPITDIAAFHCQQAVEKTLKAYLLYRGQAFEKIHDLGALVQQCADHDGGFVKLLARVAPLTPFAVRFRYPGPGGASVDQVRSALDVVEEVREIVTNRLPEEARPG